MTVDDGSGAAPVTITFATTDNTTAKKITAINTQLAAAGSTVTASGTTAVTFTSTSDKPITITASTAIQTDLALGASTTSTNGVAGMSTVRQSLMNQYNNLLTQINQLASDAGYNGTNLLNGDKLTLNFNENATSKIDIQMVDQNNTALPINTTNLGLTAQTDFSANATLDGLTTTLNSALTTLQTQSTAISSSLSVVQTRQDFTKNMVNTLQTGADNLVLADPNQEGANLLALQTRQSLSTTALSMAAQQQSAVLRLFQ